MDLAYTKTIGDREGTERYENFEAGWRAGVEFAAKVDGHADDCTGHVHGPCDCGVEGEGLGCSPGRPATGEPS